MCGKLSYAKGGVSIEELLSLFSFYFKQDKNGQHTGFLFEKSYDKT